MTLLSLLQNLENFKLLFLVCQFLLGGLDRCDAVGVLGDRHQAPESVPEKEKKSKCDDMVESTWPIGTSCLRKHRRGECQAEGSVGGNHSYFGS